MEKTSVPELYLSNAPNPMIEYKLRQEAARKFSDIELRNAVEAFVVLARCDQMTYDKLELEERKEKKAWLIKYQINRLKVCN